MTKLTPGKSITRETATLVRGVPLVVEVHDKHLEYRVKGERETFPLSHEQAFELARRLTDLLRREATYKAIAVERQRARKVARLGGRP